MAANSPTGIGTTNRIYYSQEAAERAQREQTTLVVLALSFGVVTGAVLALLFAPKPQPKSRDLGHVVEDALSAGRDSASHALNRLEKEFNELKKSVEQRVR